MRMTERTKILYLDDKPETVTSIVEHLSQFFDVTLLTSAKNARELLLETPFDLIILDWRLIDQEESGAEVLRLIRKENAQIKVIMVTANLNYLPDLEDLVNLGISKLFFKNEEHLLDDLTAAVSEVVESRDAIIQGLEDWLEARKAMKDTVVYVAGDKSYTAEQLLNEIKKNSEIGRTQTRVLVEHIFDSLIRERREPRK